VNRRSSNGPGIYLPVFAGHSCIFAELLDFTNHTESDMLRFV